ASRARRRARTSESATAVTTKAGIRRSVTVADADIPPALSGGQRDKIPGHGLFISASRFCKNTRGIGDNETQMRRWRVPLILAACFLFRLLFGLSREFFFEDETQIFLLGFRYYATGDWPFFGPDVVWTRSEIPGALQALLVGLPFRVAPIPEAPFVL